MVRVFNFLFLLVCSTGLSQTGNLVDSLKQQLAVTKIDTNRINILIDLSIEYRNVSLDSSTSYAAQALTLADKIKFLKGKGYALKNLGTTDYVRGNYYNTMDYYNRALTAFEELKDNTGISNLYNNIGAVYYSQGDNEKGLENYLNGLKYAEYSGDNFRTLTVLYNIAGLYNKPETQEKAKHYFLKAAEIARKVKDFITFSSVAVELGSIYYSQKDTAKALLYYAEALKAGGDSSHIFLNIGKLYAGEGNYYLAIKNQERALSLSEKKEKGKFLSINPLLELGKTYSKKRDYKNATVYLKKAENFALQSGIQMDLKNIYSNLAAVYAAIPDYLNTYKYQNLLAAIKDSLHNIDMDVKITTLQFSNVLQRKKDSALAVKEKEVQKLRLDQVTSQNHFRTYLFLGGLGILLTAAIFLFRSNRRKQKVNALLVQQKEKIELTLSELKSTQSQLIQSEKMASLGELTAGIAHEIQNPLNFVNNFSEVNAELIDELKNETQKVEGERNSDLEYELLNDIEENERKINHHGKRADAIVKGMLQHSRTSTGQKEPTDINALCDEYLRLSYHGFRAKEKSFNATIKSDFDSSIGTVNIIPQDIGRVLLNLYNNAFYAVNERQKAEGEEFKAMVTVETKKIKDSIEITVTDNGAGIPQNIVDKIFQPFFTTKPTGQGTGLGLSLSYDIVKVHSGELKVATLPTGRQAKEGEGTSFTIQLPVT